MEIIGLSWDGRLIGCGPPASGHRLVVADPCQAQRLRRGWPRPGDAVPQARRFGHERLPLGFIERMEAILHLPIGVGPVTPLALMEHLALAQPDPERAQTLVVGGAVRRLLAASLWPWRDAGGPATAPFGDLDLVTTALPLEVDALRLRLWGLPASSSLARAHGTCTIHSPCPGTELDRVDISTFLLDGAYSSARCEDGEGGRLYRAFGASLCADAVRRDASMNSLYYDPQTREVLDPVGTGMADLHAACWRANPHFADQNETLALRMALQTARPSLWRPDVETRRRAAENAARHWPNAAQLDNSLRRLSHSDKGQLLRGLDCYPELLPWVTAHLLPALGRSR